MNIPRYWRLRNQRYSMVGEICQQCGEKIFPPRDVCPECREYLGPFDGNAVAGESFQAAQIGENEPLEDRRIQERSR